MENVILVVHLVLALCLIGVVLLQRSEAGGGLLGGGGAITGRPALTPLGKVTWVFAAAFIVTSLGLTVVAARNSAESSILDRIGATPATDQTAPVTPPAGGDLLPPALGDGPLTPPPPAD